MDLKDLKVLESMAMKHFKLTLLITLGLLALSFNFTEGKSMDAQNVKIEGHWDKSTRRLKFSVRNDSSKAVWLIKEYDHSTIKINFLDKEKVEIAFQDPRVAEDHDPKPATHNELLAGKSIEVTVDIPKDSKELVFDRRKYVAASLRYAQATASVNFQKPSETTASEEISSPLISID